MQYFEVKSSDLSSFANCKDENIHGTITKHPLYARKSFIFFLSLFFIANVDSCPSGQLRAYWPHVAQRILSPQRNKWALRISKGPWEDTPERKKKKTEEAHEHLHWHDARYDVTASSNRIRVSTKLSMSSPTCRLLVPRCLVFSLLQADIQPRWRKVKLQT